MKFQWGRILQYLSQTVFADPKHVNNLQWVKSVQKWLGSHFGGKQ